MYEPSDMRFYAMSGSAVPVGPKAMHTYRGKLRKVYNVAEASRVSGWPPAALISLHEATYPSMPVETGDYSEGWADELAEAMFHDPRVRARLAFHTRSLGSVPPAVFLIALLDDWDSGDREAKTSSLIRAMCGDELPEAGTWSAHRRAPVEGGDYA